MTQILEQFIADFKKAGIFDDAHEKLLRNQVDLLLVEQKRLILEEGDQEWENEKVQRANMINL